MKLLPAAEVILRPELLLAAVAIGLIGYGVFNMMVARYTKYATLG